MLCPHRLRQRSPRQSRRLNRVIHCGSGGTGRHTILRGWRRKAWGFKSPLPHHFSFFFIHDVQIASYREEIA